MLLVNQSGIVLAHEDHAKVIRFENNGHPKLATLADFGVPVLAQLAPIVKEMDTENPHDTILTVNHERWHISISPLKLEGTNPLFLVSAIPDHELMATAYSLIHKLLIAMAFAIFLAVPITAIMAIVFSAFAGTRPLAVLLSRDGRL
ncbi:MAG: hypothetical protein WCP99_19645 [Burkholderiales bacterium]